MYRRQIIFLWCIVVSIISASWLWVISNSEMQKSELIAGTYKSLSNLTRSYNEHVQTTLQEGDRMLLFTQARYQATDQISKDTQEIINTMKSESKYNLLAIINKDGIVEATTDHEAIGTSLAGQDYFIYHKQNDSQTLHIGRPVLEKASGKWSFAISRRINDLSGSFKGVAVAVVDANYFTDFYRKMELDDTMFIVMIGTEDAIIRGRQAADDSSLGQYVPTAPVFNYLKNNPKGIFNDMGAVAHRKRFMAYELMPNFPLVVVVGIDEEAALEQYNNNRLYNIKLLALETLMLIFVSGILSWLAFKNYKATLLIREKTHQLQNEIAEKILANEEIVKAKTTYQDMFDKSYAVKLLVNGESGEIINANNAACEFYGYTIEHLKTMNISETNSLTHQEIAQRMVLAKTSQRPYFEFQHRLSSGEHREVEVFSSPIRINDQMYLHSIINDVTQRKEIEEKLIQSEQKYKLLFTSMKDAFSHQSILCDELGTPIDYRFITANPSFEMMTGLKSEAIIGKTATEVLPYVDKSMIELYGRVALTGEPLHLNTFSESLNKYFEVKAYCPSPQEFATIFMDITERVGNEKNIHYLSFHDVLTGLYNRRFYEEEIRRLDTERNLPISIIMGDVNGLKLINDAFGHLKGDELLQKAALAIRSTCRKDDIAARWGGDEFVILLPKTKAEVAEEIVKRILETYANEHVNSIRGSISFGWDTKCSLDDDILKTLKNAEDLMYKNKTLESEKIRLNTIKGLMTILHEHHPGAEQHSKRVSELCQDLGRAMGLAEWEVCKVRTAGFYHDIGNVSIEEDILNKPGKLLEEEWDQIKRHSEVGFRILSSSHEMSELADYVLSHHERWDGTGYPKGLKGKDIPIEARIIALVSSYVTMTSERPYRSAFREEEAVQEILKNAGTQFDPEIARVFVEKLLNKHN